MELETNSVVGYLGFSVALKVEICKMKDLLGSWKVEWRLKSFNLNYNKWQGRPAVQDDDSWEARRRLVEDSSIYSVSSVLQVSLWTVSFGWTMLSTSLQRECQHVWHSLQSTTSNKNRSTHPVPSASQSHSSLSFNRRVLNSRVGEGLGCWRTDPTERPITRWKVSHSIQLITKHPDSSTGTTFYWRSSPCV